MHNSKPPYVLIETDHSFAKDWLAPVIIAGVCLASTYYSFLLFHTLAEFFAILIALLMGIVSWYLYPFSRNNFLLFLGCAYFWIGMLDLAHTLIYKGMPLFNISGANPSTQFWIATRYLEAVTLLCAPAFLTQTVNRSLAFSGFGAIAALFFFAIMQGIIPDTFIEGSGLTPFKIYSEYLIIAILIAACLHLWSKREYTDPVIVRLMILSMLLTMGAELAFTFYISVYGISNLVGHIFKIFSFWAIYLAIIQTSLLKPFQVMARDSSTYDAIPNAVITTDRSGRIWQANDQACNLSGLRRQQLIGSHCHAIFHDPATPPDRCPACHHIATFQAAQFMELHVPEKSCWLDLTLSTIKRESGIEGMVQSIRDITQRKHTEERLEEAQQSIRDSEQRFQDMVRNIPGVVYQFTISPDGTPAFPYVSPTMQSVMNLRPEAVMNNAGLWLDAIHPEDRDQFDQSLDNSRHNLAPWQWEGRMVHHDGFVGWYHLTSIPRQLEDGTVLWNGLLYDISERKQIDQELDLHRHHLEETVAARTLELATARDEALQAAEAKSTFLANMSHELRTPLNSIIGFSGIIKNGMSGPLNDNLQEQVEIIYDSAQHLLALINDILDLSRIEANKDTINNEPFELQTVINEILAMVNPMMDAKHLSVRTDIQDANQVIISDRSKIKQILVNLISNAIKFTDRGHITLSARYQDNRLFMEVSDTGIGIDKQYQYSIFDAFQQVENGDTRSYQGTGLGLAICKRYIELLGGEIGLDSIPGKGSRFYFNLPVIKQPEDNDNTSESDKIDTRMPKPVILVVEDDPEYHALMHLYLDHQYEVKTCDHAEQTVIEAINHSPMAILLDILMPVVDGWTVLRRLKMQPETRDIPVIIVSNYDNLIKSKSLGAFGSLSKPVEPSRLLDLLDEIRQQRLTTDSRAAGRHDTSA